MTLKDLNEKQDLSQVRGESIPITYRSTKATRAAYLSKYAVAMTNMSVNNIKVPVVIDASFTDAGTPRLIEDAGIYFTCESWIGVGLGAKVSNKEGKLPPIAAVKALHEKGKIDGANLTNFVEISQKEVPEAVDVIWQPKTYVEKEVKLPSGEQTSTKKTTIKSVLKTNPNPITFDDSTKADIEKFVESVGFVVLGYDYQVRFPTPGKKVFIKLAYTGSGNHKWRKL